MRPLFWAALFAGTMLSQDTPTFTSRVRLVRMLVSVKTAAGQIVSNLGKENFEITDNGVPQEVAVFERGTSLPLSIAVLVDNSGSTGREVKYELDAATRFFKAVTSAGNPDDSIGLYSFNWEVRQQTEFTRDVRNLEGRLRQLRFEAGTSMYDAIYFGSRDLRRRPGRHVMVIVTDGGDTTSAKTYQEAVEELQNADTVVYPVLVVPIQNPVGHNVGGENALTTISQQTGGEMFRPSAGPALDEAFDQILRNLRTQYLVGFYPKNVPSVKNRFHQTLIRTSPAELRVFARSGYYEEAENVAPSPNRRGFRPAHPY